MIKKFKFIALSSLATFSLLSMAGCKEECDNVLDGVYCLTNKGYKTYLERIAEAHHLGKTWVRSVINGGDGGDYSGYIVGQDFHYCCIIGEEITVSRQTSIPYTFYKEDDKYNGYFMNYYNVSFYREENFLYVDGLQYKKDYRYKRNESLDYKLEPPREINDIYVNKDDVCFRYFPYEKCGDVGFCYEILKPAPLYCEKMIGYGTYYHGDYVVQIFRNELSNGDNILKIYHLGSVGCTNSYDLIKTENSDYVTYKVTVNEESIVGVSKVED